MRKLPRRLMEFFRNPKGRSQSLIEIGILFILTVFAHGLFARQTVFHWDDWAFAWLRNFRTPREFFDVFSSLRPLQGAIQMVLTYVLGVNPVAWQVFSLLTRWIVTVVFLWYLNTSFPSNRRLNFIASLFFLVYPGFIQQVLAQTYYYAWVFLSVCFISFIMMVKAVRQQKPIFSVLLLGSAALSLLSLYSTEYNFGLELVRPVLIWFALASAGFSFGKRLLCTLQYYAPFFLTLVLYLIWRFFIFTNAFYQPALLNNANRQPFDALLNLVQTTLKTIVLVSAQAWGTIFQVPPATSFSERLWVLVIVILLGTFFGLLAFLNRRTGEGSQEDRSQVRPMLVIGFASILVVGIPFYIVDLPVSLRYPFDRFTYPFMFSVSLVLAGLLGLFRHRTQAYVLASLLVALAVGYHIHVNNSFRSETQRVQGFIWELTWRAPGLEPGTVIVTEDMDTFPYEDDEALGFAIDWAYHPENKNGEIHYSYLFASSQVNAIIPAFAPGLPIAYERISGRFESTTDQILFLEYNPPACLHILTKMYDEERISLLLDPEMAWRQDRTQVRLLSEPAQAAILQSNLDQIIVNPQADAVPPEFLFGSEPAHRWCYYYQKADLARQSGDWEQVVRIADDVFAVPYHPDDFYEYLLFIDGYLHMDRWEDARMLSMQVSETGAVLRPAVCRLWRTEEQTLQRDADRIQIQRMIEELGTCPSY